MIINVDVDALQHCLPCFKWLLWWDASSRKQIAALSESHGE